MSDILQHSREKSNFWGVMLRQITDYTDSEVRPLVHELYKNGYSTEKVAKLLGVTKQAVSNRFPKKGMEAHE